MVLQPNATELNRTAPSPIAGESRGGFLDWLTVHELSVILLFSAALFLLNLVTALAYPTCWMDETLFSDPAINFLQGKGFTSTTWWQSRTLMWSGNVPLYTLALIPWFKLVGISLVKARAFNYAVISVTLLTWWLGIKRLRLISFAPLRLGLIVTVALGYTMISVYRSARPDCLGMLLCAIALLAWSWENRAIGCLVLFGVGFLAPFSGLQLCAYLGFLCVPVWSIERNKSLLRLVMLMVGVVAGAVVLFSWYHDNHLTGVAETGRIAREYHEYALAGGVDKHLDSVMRVKVIAIRIFKDHLKDAGLTPTLLALLLLACDPKIWVAAKTRFLLLFGLLSTLVLVSALEAFLHYLDYYHWMNYVLMALALFALLDHVWVRLGMVRKGAIILLLAGSIGVGMPLRIGLGLALDPAGEFAQLEKNVAGQVRSKDVVFCDFTGYFPAKTRAADVFEPPYLKTMTERERQAVNVLILNRAAIDAYRETFSQAGQQWKVVAEVSSAPGFWRRLVKRFLPNYDTQPTNSGYGLTILRREPAP